MPRPIDLTLTPFFAFVAAAASPQAHAQGAAPSSAPGVEPAAPELGRVRWRRDLEAALETARDKPTFVLFQEVPG